jgi:hypothetical protein
LVRADCQSFQWHLVPSAAKFAAQCGVQIGRLATRERGKRKRKKNNGELVAHCGDYSTKNKVVHIVSKHHSNVTLRLHKVMITWL